MFGQFSKNLIKYFSSSSHLFNPKICIIGSGPAGFYTAEHLLKKHPDSLVDIYEKLPVPFGLVRYGIAPDHPEVRNCIKNFSELAKNERFSFLGNVTVGKDVTLDQLTEAYDAAVLCYGASEDKRMGIPGESLPNVVSARRFVGWYNGFPEDVDLNINLEDVEEAVVIGQGNVAIDVSRILLRSVDELKKTDIPECVLEKLSKSRIKRVTMVGRRRVEHAPFTPKEVREMIKLNNCKANFLKEDFEHLSSLIPDAPRTRKRLWELLYKTSCAPSSEQLKKWEKDSREWRLRFQLSPIEILSKDGGQHGIKGMKCTVNRVENGKAFPTNETEVIECGLVLRSIGYSCVSIDDSLKFDNQTGAIQCSPYGKVTGLPGVYASGWIATGPVGILPSTMQSTFVTGDTIASDLQSGEIPLKGKEGKKKIVEILAEKEVIPVSFENWCLIDKYEVERGKAFGKPREKITSIKEMIEIAHNKISPL